MGIKTIFNPVGGQSGGSIDPDPGKLSLWRYSNSIIEGKTLLYNYIGSWSDSILYVPKVRGNSILNDWHDISTSGILESNRNTPFYNNLNVKSVNLQDVPFRNNSMGYAFFNCRNLVSVANIPNYISNIIGVFSNCYNFNQNIQIPNLVTNMSNVFSNCYKFNFNVQIPNSVTRMPYTFRNCINFNQNIRIPNSVINLLGTFDYSNFNQKVIIPNSVSDMSITFYHCSNFNQNVQVGKNVSELFQAFCLCNKFSSWINIFSPEILSASGAFDTNNASAIPNVFIISRRINNTLSQTYNSFNSSGWKWSDANVVGTSPNRVRCWSLGWCNYHNAYPNGTHVLLNNWHGTMDAFLNNGIVCTEVAVPEYLTVGVDGNPLNYDYPAALNYPCFSGNHVISSVDIGTNIPWVGNSMGHYKNSKSYHGAFCNCLNLKEVRGVVADGVTNISCVHYINSTNFKSDDLILPETVVTTTLFEWAPALIDPAPLPSSVTSMWSTYREARVLSNSPVIPPNVTVAATLFYNCKSIQGNIYWLSPVTSNITNTFQLHNTGLRKNIYIYFQYSNGVNTPTYNAFKANNFYKATSGNTTDPMYNSTSNFYVYNLSAKYNDLWSYSYNIVPAHKMIYFIKYKGTDPHVALMGNYPDYTPGSIHPNCFNGCSTMRSVALYGTRFNTSAVGANNCQNIFRNCYNLRVVQGLDFNNTICNSSYCTAIDLSNGFRNCRNLRVMSTIPYKVVNLSHTFAGCSNFNFNVQIEEGPVNMFATFWDCVNLNRNIHLPNSAVNLCDTFQGCTNLKQNIQIGTNADNLVGTFMQCSNLTGRINILGSNVSNAYACFNFSSKFKEVHIPYKYANGVYTKTFNSFVTAGYLYRNEVSTGADNTQFYNIVL